MTPKERDEARIAELVKLDVQRAEIWRYYSDRADRFTDQLWTTGTWILGIIAAVLSLPFVAKFVVIDSTSLVKFESRILTVVVCVFGIILCGYSLAVLTDIRQHLQRNWERADLARTGEWKASSWDGPKFRGWWMLMVFGSGAFVGFIGLLVMAVVW